MRVVSSAWQIIQFTPRMPFCMLYNCYIIDDSAYKLILLFIFLVTLWIETRELINTFVCVYYSQIWIVFLIYHNNTI